MAIRFSASEIYAGDTRRYRPGADGSPGRVRTWNLRKQHHGQRRRRICAGTPLVLSLGNTSSASDPRSIRIREVDGAIGHRCLLGVHSFLREQHCRAGEGTMALAVVQASGTTTDIMRSRRRVRAKRRDCSANAPRAPNAWGAAVGRPVGSHACGMPYASRTASASGIDESVAVSCPCPFAQAYAQSQGYALAASSSSERR